MKEYVWSHINRHYYLEIGDFCLRLLPYGERRKLLDKHEWVSSKSNLVNFWG